MTTSKNIRILWTKKELGVLRDAWVRGMSPKTISAMVLKHRTPGAIQMAMYLNGMKFKGNANFKRPASIGIGVPAETYEQLKSLAAEQGMTISKLCRSIIQEGVRNLNDGRTVWYREWHQWKLQHQKGPPE